MGYQTLKKELGRILNVGSRLSSMEEKLFVLGAVCVFSVELAALILNMDFGPGTGVFGILTAAIAFTMADIVYAYKTERFSLSYTILCLLVNLVLIPLIFVNAGGFRSGMPVYIVLGFVMTGTQLDRKMRLYTAAVSLLVDVVLFVLVLRYPGIVVPIPQETVCSDVIWAVYLCGISTMITMTAFLNSYRVYSDKNRREYEQKTEIRMALLESQVDNIGDIKRQRHNMRHHNQIIMAFAERNDVQGLRRYLREKQYSDEFYTRRLYCHNVMINNILTIYDRIAKKKNVVLDIKTDVSSDLAISEKELTALVSTIVENAINGAEISGSEDRTVELNIHEKGRRLILNCSNPCSPDISGNEKYPGVPGSGIEEIEAILDERGGLLDYRIESGRVSCHMIVDAI